MDHSFVLLSSMSPRVNKATNPSIQKKIPTLLALKKNLRRSSNFDNVCPPARFRPSVVLIESSTASTNSSECPKNILNETPIVIPDSDEEIVKSHRDLSQSKLVTITDWVKNVNVQQFSSGDNNIKSALYDFDDVLGSLPKNLDYECVGSNNDRLQDSNSTDSGASSSSSKFHAQILDELYRDTWKNLKNDLIPKSTPRRKRNDIHINRSKTEVRPKLYTSNVNTPISPWVKSLKGLCDSDSCEDNSITNERVKTSHKLNFNSDDNRSSSSSSSSKKKYFDQDSPSDLSDEVKTKPVKKLPKTKSKDGGNGKAKSKTAVKQKDQDKKSAKSQSKSADKKESLALDRNGTDKCIRKITSTKENCNRSKTNSFLASLSGSVQLSQCDPSARLFRNNFKGYKEELLKKLFKLYNETVFDNNIPEDTLFEWNDRMRGTAGFCYCRKVTRRTGLIERKARIVLSTKVVDSCDRLRDTLIHELCHAATWIVNKEANGHGDYWKAWAAKALRCFPELPPIKRCHDYIINTKYTYRCVDCGYSIGRHSKSLDIERKRCGYCYGKFEVLLNKTTKGGQTKSVPVTPKKVLSGFALFVKEHYATYKTPQLNHGQVMKLLGQKFNEAKVSPEVQIK